MGLGQRAIQENEGEVSVEGKEPEVSIFAAIYQVKRAQCEFVQRQIGQPLYAAINLTFAARSRVGVPEKMQSKSGVHELHIISLLGNSILWISLAEVSCGPLEVIHSQGFTKGVLIRRSAVRAGAWRWIQATSDWTLDRAGEVLHT